MPGAVRCVPHAARHSPRGACANPVASVGRAPIQRSVRIMRCHHASPHVAHRLHARTLPGHCPPHDMHTLRHSVVCLDGSFPSHAQYLRHIGACLDARSRACRQFTIHTLRHFGVCPLASFLPRCENLRQTAACLDGRYLQSRNLRHIGACLDASFSSRNPAAYWGMPARPLRRGAVFAFRQSYGASDA